MQTYICTYMHTNKTILTDTLMNTSVHFSNHTPIHECLYLIFTQSGHKCLRTGWMTDNCVINLTPIHACHKSRFIHKQHWLLANILVEWPSSGKPLQPKILISKLVFTLIHSTSLYFKIGINWFITGEVSSFMSWVRGDSITDTD